MSFNFCKYFFGLCVFADTATLAEQPEVAAAIARTFRNKNQLPRPRKPPAGQDSRFDTTVLGIREFMRYSPVVKIRYLSLVLLAGVAMLSMQMAGLHLHAGEPSGDGGVHGAHMHNVEPDGHDHSKAVDVTLVDLGIVWSKLMPVILTAFPTMLAVVWLLQTLWPPPIALIPLRRRSRWRPPLRAPPLSP